MENKQHSDHTNEASDNRNKARYTQPGSLDTNCKECGKEIDVQKACNFEGLVICPSCYLQLTSKSGAPDLTTGDRRESTFERKGIGSLEKSEPVDCFFCNREMGDEECGHVVPPEGESHVRERSDNQRPKNNQSIKYFLIGIVFCILGIGLSLFAIWWWFILLKEGSGIIATAMAGGIIGVAVGFFKLGTSAFNE